MRLASLGCSAFAVNCLSKFGEFTWVTPGISSSLTSISSSYGAAPEEAQPGTSHTRTQSSSWKTLRATAAAGLVFGGLLCQPAKCAEANLEPVVHSSFDIDPDRLQLLNPLSTEGSIGQVWVGELSDGTHHEKVAVKVLPTAANERLKSALERETSVLCLAALRCHHVCRLYGICKKDGHLCLVMKMYQTSLSGLMAKQGGKLTLSQVKQYGSDVLKGLVELHEQGIIVQDLKPSNILLDDMGDAVLADFGVSTLVEQTVGCSVVSSAKGTPSYMAPEAWDPDGLGGVSPATDVWSFACTILEALTGHPPWEGMRLAVISRRVVDRMEAPEVPQQVPEPLRSLLQRCFNYHADMRPTARDLLQAFQSEWPPSTAQQQQQARQNLCSQTMHASLKLPAQQRQAVPSS